MPVCCSFLVNSEQDFENRKWAAEGMAFLTLDAEVKEDLVQDKEALRALFELAKVCGMWVGWVSLFVSHLH